MFHGYESRAQQGSLSKNRTVFCHNLAGHVCKPIDSLVSDLSTSMVNQVKFDHKLHFVVTIRVCVAIST